MTVRLDETHVASGHRRAPTCLNDWYIRDPTISYNLACILGARIPFDLSTCSNLRQRPTQIDTGLETKLEESWIPQPGPGIAGLQ